MNRACQLGSARGRTTRGQSWFREVCFGCGCASSAGFCGVCARALARVADPCERCGLPQPVAHCPRRTHEWRMAAVVAPFVYAPPLDGYVKAFKYRGVRHLGRALGLLLAESLEPLAREIDALVPVPLHARRLRERGFNQAAEIARTLGRALQRPVLERGIERRVDVVPQAGQTAAERRANVAGAFAVRRDLAGARLAIVDDVLTTGATVDALVAALAAAGAVRCCAVAVARAL